MFNYTNYEVNLRCQVCILPKIDIWNNEKMNYFIFLVKKQCALLFFLSNGVDNLLQAIKDINIGGGNLWAERKTKI